MARGVNKVILVGHLGQDPETKYTQGGMAITTISLATTSVRKDRDGNQQEQAEWHRVKFFGKTAEIAGEYLRKGKQVYVEGRIHYDRYEKDGETRYITEIIGEDMQMLGGGNGEQQQSRGGGRAPTQQQRQQSRPQRPQQQRQPEPQQQDFADDFADDDIPF